MFHRIALNNGKEAVLISYRQAIIPDVNPKDPTDIYTYEFPCSFCGTPNRVTSFNGTTFSTNQVFCRSCGIAQRPQVKPPEVKP